MERTLEGVRIKCGSCNWIKEEIVRFYGKNTKEKQEKSLLKLQTTLCMTNLFPKSRRIRSRFIPSTVTLTCCHPKSFVPKEKVGLIAADS